MASMNAGIILGGRQPDLVNTLARSTAAAGQANALQDQNALRQLYQQQGAGILNGDQGAMNALAGLNPQAAFGMHQQRQAGNRAQNADTRADEMHKIKLKEYARSLSAQQAAEQAAEIEQGIVSGIRSYQAGDLDGLNQMLTSVGEDPLNSLEEFPAVAAMYGDALEILKEVAGFGQGGDVPAGFDALNRQAQAAGLEPGSQDYQGFMLNGGGDPATYRALVLQAQGAGFQPGTPEFQEFMATRGAGFAAGAKTTATNRANIETGGPAAAAIAQGREQGKATATRGMELEEMQRNMPSLMTVVGRLSDLGKTATYTKGGQLADEAMKQLGVDPSEGAIARTEYIAVVANQILPLLRQTFGAAFTAQEGESLKATLGDPDMSPAQKDAVLKSFIEQKKRDLKARGGTVPGAESKDKGDISFEAFSQQPTAIDAARNAGVTLEEMWAIRQGG